MNSFREIKMKNERGSTPREVINDVTEELDAIDDILIIHKSDCGIIETYFSCGNILELIGMLEAAKHQAMSAMDETVELFDD